MFEFDFIELPVGSFSPLSHIRLYRKTIEKVAQFHPEVPAELPSILSAVACCIKAPSFVATSYGNSYVFVDEVSVNRSGLPLLVAVKERLIGTGPLSSAFRAREVFLFCSPTGVGKDHLEARR